MKSFIIAGCIVPGDKSSKIAFSWQETFYRDSILFFVHFFRDGLPFSESFLQRRYILFGSSLNLRDIISVCSFWQRRVQKSFFRRDFWICCFFLEISCSRGIKRDHTHQTSRSLVAKMEQDYLTSHQEEPQSLACTLQLETSTNYEMDEAFAKRSLINATSSHRYLQRGSHGRAAKERRRIHRCSKKERKRYHPCFEGEQTRVYRCY